MSKRLDKSQLSDSEEEIGRFVWSGCSSIDWRCWSQICWKFRQSSSGTSPISCCSETGPRAGGWGGILDNEVRIKVTFRKCWLQQWLQGEPGTEEGFWMLLRMRRKFSWESSDGFTDDHDYFNADHDIKILYSDYLRDVRWPPQDRSCCKPRLRTIVWKVFAI